MSALGASPNQARRYFAVGLRDNKVRIVFPAENDPLCFEQQIVIGQHPFEGEERAFVLHPPDRRTPLF
jgi:hypothetical protein